MSTDAILNQSEPNVTLTVHATKVNRTEPNWTEPQTCLACQNHALNSIRLNSHMSYVSREFIRDNDAVPFLQIVVTVLIVSLPQPIKTYGEAYVNVGDFHPVDTVDLSITQLAVHSSYTAAPPKTAPSSFVSRL